MGIFPSPAELYGVIIVRVTPRSHAEPQREMSLKHRVPEEWGDVQDRWLSAEGAECRIHETVGV